MDFGGDLSILSPDLVIQLIGMAALTGKIKFITTGNLASFYFERGELVFANIETRQKRIGEFLIGIGVINEKQLDSALEEYRSKGGGKRIGNILIDRGHLDYEALASAIQEQMKEDVYEVLQWSEGQFSYFDRVLPKDEDILLDVKMDHLILEGLRRLDETKKDSK